MRKVHEAKLAGRDAVEVWGSGQPMREFLYVDDMADACVYLMGKEDFSGMTNIGTGIDVSIRELAEQIVRCLGSTGN